MNSINIELLEDLKDFEDLRDVWNRLVDSSDSPDIVLTWEWLFTWWGIFQENRRLWILVVRDDREIIGIAPFLIRKVCYYGIFPFRRVELLGTGEDEEDEICSDYLKFIAKKGLEKTITKVVYSYLIENNQEWDELYLANLPESSEYTEGLSEYFKKGPFESRVLYRDNCPYIELPSSWDTLMENASRNFRQSLNKKRRRLLNEGVAEYYAINQEQDYEEAFEIIKDLHQFTWESKGKPGCFKSQKFTLFHKNLIFLLAPLNRVQLYFLKLDGNYISGRYCFSYQDKVYDYLSGLKDTIQANVSPGNLLLAYCIENSIAMGKKKFDFFKGSRGTYKYQWTEVERVVVTVRVAQNSLVNRIYKLVRLISFSSHTPIRKRW